MTFYVLLKLLHLLILKRKITPLLKKERKKNVVLLLQVVAVFSSFLMWVQFVWYQLPAFFSVFCAAKHEKIVGLYKIDRKLL